MDPDLVCRRCKVFSLKPTKPNKFNQSKTTIPLLMKLGDEPCKAEQPLRGMELQEKEKDKSYRGNFIKNPFIFYKHLYLRSKESTLCRPVETGGGLGGLQPPLPPPP